MPLTPFFTDANRADRFLALNHDKAACLPHTISLEEEEVLQSVDVKSGENCNLLRAATDVCVQALDSKGASDCTGITFESIIACWRIFYYYDQTSRQSLIIDLCNGKHNNFPRCTESGQADYSLRSSVKQLAPVSAKQASPFRPSLECNRRGLSLEKQKSQQANIQMSLIRL